LLETNKLCVIVSAHEVDVIRLAWSVPAPGGWVQASEDAAARFNPAVVRWLWRASILWVVIFWRLGYLSLFDPDEAHYAEISREMMAAREWFVPLLEGKPFIDKPILFHWFQSLSFLGFGTTEFAARLPSACAAVALLWITYWTGRELFDAPTGRRAALMLVTMPATFALKNVALLDMVFTAFLFGAVACLVVSVARDRPHLQWAGYGLLALATMIKGPIAVLLLAIAFGAAVLFARSCRPELRRLRWILGPSVAVALAAPWFLWMWWVFGDAFMQRYVVEGNVWYLTHPFRFRRANHFFYLRTFFGAFLPWSLLFAGRLLDLIRSRFRGDAFMGRASVLLWCWTIAVLIVFTAARFKLDHYIYPAAPAVCLIAARGWGAARKGGMVAACQRASVAVIPVLFVSAGAVIGLSMFTLDLRVQTAAVTLPIALVVGGVAFAARLRAEGWRPPQEITSIAVTMLAVFVAVIVFGYPLLERMRPTPAAARWIAAHQPEAAPVGVFELQRWEASLRFYSGRPVERLETMAHLEAFLARPGPRSVVMLRRHYRSLVAMGVPLQVGFDRDAVVGTEGRGLRRQQWGRLMVLIPAVDDRTRAADRGALER